MEIPLKAELVIVPKPWCHHPVSEVTLTHFNDIQTHVVVWAIRNERWKCHNSAILFFFLYTSFVTVDGNQ